MFARYITAVTSGTFVTLVLLFVMQALITSPAGMHEPSIPNILLWPGRTVEERPVEKEDLHKKFDDIKDPLDLSPPRPGPDFRVDSVGVQLNHVPSPTPTSFDGLGSVIQDGPLVSIVRVRPMYPVWASEKGLEGYVDVQFDINKNGTVTNVSVIASTHRIFEKAAIKAAKKFRFKARVVDGIPQPSFGIQNRFRFRMERT